jgi:uncharacterized protein
MVYVALILLVAALIAGWLLTLFSLPGNWLIVLAVALFVGLFPEAPAWGLSWTLIGILGLLAALGEAMEFLAAAMGATRRGGSKRGAVLAILGSFVGAVLGAGIGLPIPLIGSVVGVILGACAGALAGAMLGEAWKGRSFDESWHIGQGAFWGRLLGSIAKITIASMMVVTTLAAVVGHRVFG